MALCCRLSSEGRQRSIYIKHQKQLRKKKRRKKKYQLINVTWEENVKRKRKKEENMKEGGKTKDKWEIKLKG
jgi:hypothetical protein